MGSPIFDATFGTGRFKSEEPMTTDQSQSDAEPKGIDLDDADRAYDKWAEHRNGHSRLDAFRAGVEFGLRHTAPPRHDVSGLIIKLKEKVRFWQGEAEKWMKVVHAIDLPDASARRIEAAEWHEAKALWHRERALALRTRAADRMKGEPWTNEEKEALQKIQKLITDEEKRGALL